MFSLFCRSKLWKVLVVGNDLPSLLRKDKILSYHTAAGTACCALSCRLPAKTPEIGNLFYDHVQSPPLTVC